mgnify:CR=1 FL=1
MGEEKLVVYDDNGKVIEELMVPLIIIEKIIRYYKNKGYKIETM